VLTTRQIVALIAAEGLKVRRDWVIEMCRKGRLPAVQIEGRWFVRPEDFASFHVRPHPWRQPWGLDKDATRRVESAS